MTEKNIGKNVIIAPITIKISVTAKHLAKQNIANLVVKVERATVPISED